MPGMACISRACTVISMRFPVMFIRLELAYIKSPSNPIVGTAPSARTQSVDSDLYGITRT